MFRLKSFSILMDQAGQSAIFVALMFNVLFVFFAMALNVALVVHDKINLQNSTDLAAYYVAEKQAEILNAIAEENYAIRQSWKLLAWRYRVLGTLGLDRPPNASPVWLGSLTEAAAPEADDAAACVVYKRKGTLGPWSDTQEGQNLCNTVGLKIPALPKVPVIAGFNGLNIGIAALSIALRNQFNDECDYLGSRNWFFAMSILQAFRIDQRNRKKIIYALAQSLAGGKNGDFTDLDGNSVLAGAQKTFEKNLTWTNKQSNPTIQIYNSLQGVDPKTWLSEIQIAPTVAYVDVTNEEGCNASDQLVQTLPARTTADQQLLQPPPAGFGAGNLEQWRFDQVLKDSDYQFSLGVEKNPWVMAYVGVKAETEPSEAFLPLGSATKMVARAFAKPFGGRIGPWYSQRWNQGDNTSSGNPVDQLVPPRLDPQGFMEDPKDTRRLPNYSRFPGDTLGLKSALAQNSLSNLATLSMTLDNFRNIKTDFTPGGQNDILAWDSTANRAPAVRSDELAAIAPDLFDITYYSIAPNFGANYYQKIQANRAALGIPSDVPVRPDLGADGSAIPVYSVQDQMKTAESQKLQRPEAFYFVRSKANLLTDWLPGDGTYNYAVDSSMANFGKCAVPDDDFKYKNPGSCVAGGGRTGYSVKLISRDMLFSSQLRIGGSDAPPGAILNPPGQGW